PDEFPPSGTGSFNLHTESEATDLPPALPLGSTPGAPLPPLPSGVDSYGIASIIVSLLSLPVAGCCSFMCMPFGILGLLGAIAGGILAMIGIRKARREGRRSVPSIIGLILAILSGLVVLLYIGFF